MTTAEKRTIAEALKRFELISGAGSEESNQACAMTMLAWVAKREWTDAPPCAHSLIRNAVISVNDASGTTPAMRAKIVRAGAKGILDTWWVPDIVIAEAFALREGDSQSPFERLLRALQRIADWKRAKGLPPVLTRANLTGANLTGAYLTRADLTGANLTGANLTGANLTGAYLTGAYLTGAYLTRADLTGANLTGAVGTPWGGMPERWKQNEIGLWVRA